MNRLRVWLIRRIGGDKPRAVEPYKQWESQNYIHLEYVPGWQERERRRGWKQETH